MNMIRLVRKKSERKMTKHMRGSSGYDNRFFSIFGRKQIAHEYEDYVSEEIWNPKIHNSLTRFSNKPKTAPEGVYTATLKTRSYKSITITTI